MDFLSRLGLRKPVRTEIPGGGSVVIPARYDVVPPGDYRHRDGDVVVAYRRWHSTMAGTSECNGMIAVGRQACADSLEAFVRTGRALLTTRWSYANESEGRWYGRPQTFTETETEGPNGPERVGNLSVHMVGWKVYDAPGCLYAVSDRRGVMIAIWIFNRDGGLRCARRYAEAIAASYTA